jgi:hypothetical protein
MPVIVLCTNRVSESCLAKGTDGRPGSAGILPAPSFLIISPEKLEDSVKKSRQDACAPRDESTALSFRVTTADAQSEVC